MKKLAILFVAMVVSGALLAADFVVDGIAYNILGGDSVEVTSKSPNYSGDITIPATVIYNSTTYRVTSIGSGAFRYSTSLTSITIPNGVTFVGNYAFDGCRSLRSVTIPNTVTIIGYEAFGDCRSLSPITIPNSVTVIADMAFSGCSSLTSITIPNSVTSIGEEAFRFCSSLSSVTIPSNVTSIGSKAFDGCDSLSSINVDAANIHYASVDGVLFNYTKDTLMQYPIGNIRTCYAVPNSVISIGNYSFRSCKSLRSITLSNSVTNVDYRAFDGCTSLGLIDIPESVTSIGGQVFGSCTSLRSVTIGKNVTSFGGWAFSYCTSLESIICYAVEPPSCDIWCFNGVNKSIPVYVPAGSVEAYKDAAQWEDFTNIKAITELTQKITYVASQKLPEATAANPCGLHTNAFNVAITDHSFSDGHGVITFSGDVTSIGDSAFYYAVLDSITIPPTVTNIGARAFESCFWLDSITIPNGVVSIGEMAFSSCASLNSVTIPESVTSIGRCAFNGCSKFTSIDVDAGNTHYVSIDGVLFNYAKDTLIQYPAGNTRASYTIPHSVTNIEEFAFFNCSNLDFVSIPSSVNSIGDGAFYGCSELDSITCEAVEPPTCDVWSFKDVVKTIPLYVPKGSVYAYQHADWWKEFTNIKAAPDVPSDLEQLTDSPIRRLNKVMMDGKVVILKEGHRYTANGGEMK